MALLKIFLQLQLAMALCVLGSCAIHADSPVCTVAFQHAVTAAARLCPVSATEMSDTAQLASHLQSATTAPVLACSNKSRSAFVDAIALPQPSGYPGDADIVPALVIQPVGMQLDNGEAVHFCVVASLRRCFRSPAAASANCSEDY